MSLSRQQLKLHQAELRACERCPDMIRPVITGEPATSGIMLIGQAPGIHEGDVGRPFGWTAGKTMFKWFESIGIDEAHFRQQVYMAAVCRCFPGKQARGSGDRVPSSKEIETCKYWLDKEFQLLQPKLIILVGKLAIQQFLEFKKLTEVVGQRLTIETIAGKVDCIPLPHPSGASTWHRMEPGKSLLADALELIRQHQKFQELNGL